KLTIREAIDFISDAWDEVSETTIRNCWKTTRIMPETNEPEESESDDKPKYETPEINNVAMLPTVTEDILTDDSIIEAVMDEFGEDNDDDNDDDEPPPPPVTMVEAVEALEKIIRYQESLDLGIGFDEYELVTLRKRLMEWRSEKEKNKKQSSLLSFFGGISTAF
ncbi:16462_t:CDS:2, partial [Gigaspora rosea]